jgi:hypothetical protein
MQCLPVSIFPKKARCAINAYRNHFLWVISKLQLPEMLTTTLALAFFLMSHGTFVFHFEPTFTLS